MTALDPDVIVDRRRIKRRLSIWRFLALLALVVAAGAVVQMATGGGLPIVGKSHVAAVDIDGLITGRKSRVELLRKIRDSAAAKALIVRIDSPGGTTAGGEVIYQELLDVAAKKPVVAVMESVAASGGYLVALAADHVIARGNTITGSIGVYIRWARIDDALASLGVEVDEIKSGPLKAEPDLFGRTSLLARTVTEKMVKDSHEWFVRLVADRRPFNITKAHILADGRVYTGRQALEDQLVDELGGEREALKWLVEHKGIDEKLEIVDWEAESTTTIPFAAHLASWAGAALGINIDQAPGLGGLVAAERLDGLLSLWHPELHR